MIAVPGLALASIMAFKGAQAIYLDLVYTAVATELSFWGREGYRPTERTVERTGQQLTALVQHSPDNPEYLTQQAYFYSWKGFFSDDVSLRLTFNEQAVATQYQAIQQRPAYRQGWGEMVEYASRSKGGAAMLEQAQARIAALQPAQM